MKNKLALFLTAACTLGVCVRPAVCIAAARDALALCADALLPSLFVFFVLSGLLLRLGLPELMQKPLAPLCRHWFGVNGCGASAVLLGFVSGYPVGTLSVKTLYQSGKISKTEAERLLAFCNNSGPLFVLGSVGTVMLGDAKAGVTLYMCHVLAAVTVGFLFRFYKHTQLPRPQKSTAFCVQPLGAAVADSVRAAVNNMLYVCGFTVLFAVLLALLPESVILNGLLEITNGCGAVCVLPLPFAQKMRLVSLVLGFGGVSVHMQLAGILADTDLSVKTSLAGKGLQAVLSYIYVYCFVR